MPKSSTASRTPSARSSSSVPTVVGRSTSSRLSVISRTRCAGSRPRLLERVADRADQAGLVEFPRGQVDADRHAAGAWGSSRARRCICRQASRSTNRPMGTIRPVCSASGMKSSGGTSPRSGCCQRTSASTPASRPVAELHGRLVVDGELAALDRPGELGLQLELADDRGVHVGREDRGAALAGLLGRVHGDVGVPQQLGGVVLAGRAGRDADAGA